MLASDIILLKTEDMYFNFETRPEDTPGLSLLTNVDHVTPHTAVEGVRIDDKIIDLEPLTTEMLRLAIAQINTEALDPEHFRDCNHFVMAMCGLWMPTHAPFSNEFSMELECREGEASTRGGGPIALGIPNDNRCLGFGNQSFVYGHSVFGINTSVGNLCLGKLGTGSEYSISTFDAVLHEYGLEVAHPISQLTVYHNSADIFHWSSQD